MNAAIEQQLWSGPRPANPQIFALMYCGVVGLMIPGLQPLLLGALAEEGRLSANQLGIVATAELLAMGLTAGFAGSLLKASRLKLVAIAALIALAILDVLTPFARGDLVMLVRGAAGVPSGILVWITIAFIARTPTPERWAGAYVTAQTLGQFIVAALASAFIAPRFGADGGFVALAALCVASVPAALLLPRDLTPLPAAATAGLPNMRGWVALAASFLFLATSSGVWVYVEQLSRQTHHAPAVAGQAVSLSLALQVAGGVAATLLAGRIRWLYALIVCAVADLAIFAGFALMPAPTLFIALTGALGFAWLFATPFLVPMTIEADPTRRAALLIGGAQLVGGSLGPLFASLFVTDADARGALVFATACVIAAGAIVLGLHATRPR
ncbi:MAG: MFS transporter [Vitreimonas sp.]